MVYVSDMEAISILLFIFDLALGQNCPIFVIDYLTNDFHFEKVLYFPPYKKCAS